MYGPSRSHYGQIGLMHGVSWEWATADIEILTVKKSLPYLLP